MSDNIDIQYLLDRPIAYHRVFVEVSGSVPGAVFLSQALYWHRRVPKGRDGWFYKSTEQWSQETGLTRNNIQSARKRLREVGVMEFEIRSFPRRAWYRLNTGNLRMAILSSQQRQTRKEPHQVTQKSSVLDSTTCSQLHSTNRSVLNATNHSLESTDQFVSNQQTDLTETTDSKNKNYIYTATALLPVDNFFPSEPDIQHFQQSRLAEPFELIVLEFKLYHRDIKTPDLTTAQWSTLLRGWLSVRANGLPDKSIDKSNH